MRSLVNPATCTIRRLPRALVPVVVGVAMLAMGSPAFGGPMPVRLQGTGTPGHSIKLSRGNPFGLVGTRTIDLQIQLAAARKFGAPYFRTLSAVVGKDVFFAQDPKQIRDAGLKIVLDIRNFPRNPFPLTEEFPSEEFPSSLDIYKRGVAKAIDEARPVLITIGNESAIPNSFGGTPQQYQSMLEAGCEVAHQHDIKCATDGMLSGSTALYTYYHLYYIEDDPQGAAAFRQNGFEEYLLGDTPEQIKARVEQYFVPWIQAYKNARPDFVNFHWYSRAGADPKGNAEALATTARVLERATGRPSISNEHGIRDDNAQILICRMNTILQLKMPYAIYYNSDAGPAHPRALMDTDGTLRPTGVAFGEFSRALNARGTLPTC
jgi:hypothetical protein